LSYDELVTKLIAEMRAAIAAMPIEENGRTHDEDEKAAAFDCIADALDAFDAAVEASRHE
jgi:hypothetical protein